MAGCLWFLIIIPEGDTATVHSSLSTVHYIGGILCLYSANIPRPLPATSAWSRSMFRQDQKLPLLYSYITLQNSVRSKNNIDFTNHFANHRFYTRLYLLNYITPNIVCQPKRIRYRDQDINFIVVLLFKNRSDP